MAEAGYGEVTQDDKLWALLSWLIWVVALIALLMEDKKSRPFIRYNAVQSLALAVVGWVLSLVLKLYLRRAASSASPGWSTSSSWPSSPTRASGSPSLPDRLLQEAGLDLDPTFINTGARHSGSAWPLKGMMRASWLTRFLFPVGVLAAVTFCCPLAACSP